MFAEYELKSVAFRGIWQVFISGSYASFECVFTLIFLPSQPPFFALSLDARRLKRPG